LAAAKWLRLALVGGLASARLLRLGLLLALTKWLGYWLAVALVAWLQLGCLGLAIGLAGAK
jgi:hypothetical protein